MGGGRISSRPYYTLACRSVGAESTNAISSPETISRHFNFSAFLEGNGSSRQSILFTGRGGDRGASSGTLYSPICRGIDGRAKLARQIQRRQGSLLGVLQSFWSGGAIGPPGDPCASGIIALKYLIDHHSGAGTEPCLPPRSKLDDGKGEFVGPQKTDQSKHPYGHR